jgi:CTP:phosphocholine cytidylyltransferase-like protein
MYTVDSAVIMSAGTSSRFAPLSYERPKALIEVKGEILIERQIRQLREAGIQEIYVVVGYKAEQFDYLKENFGVHIIRNNEYLTRNNHSSIYAARDVIKNTYICSADNYFPENPFEQYVSDSYYAALYADGHTNEWCMQTDSDGYICLVTVGGSDAWYMLGHAFWSEDFSKKFLQILCNSYDDPKIQNFFWEDLLAMHLPELKMQVRQYAPGFIFEFDSLDELRAFDSSYITDTRSSVLKRVAKQLDCAESELSDVQAITDSGKMAEGISFLGRGKKYAYIYACDKLEEIP